MRDLLRGLVDLVLPPRCAGCRGPADTALCVRCAARLPRIPASHCRLCQEREACAPLPRCGPCQARRRPLDACLAACWFEGDAADWIRGFKYPARSRGLQSPERARILALALLTAALAPEEPPDLVVPVPLHPRRLRARGFNPANTVARDLARARDLPVHATALRRVRDTGSQTGRGVRERRRNVRGAFAAPTRVPPRIWLVDDVVTTGATLEEAARALRRAGAREVIALCAARTPPPGR
jgi:ComF family protein